MKLFIKRMYILMLIGLIPIGCDKDPVSNQEGHTNADGFILEDSNGNELYREFAGATTGSIEINIGQTLELSVHFLDNEGNEIIHEDDSHNGHDDHTNEEDVLQISEYSSIIEIIEIEGHDEHCDEITDQSECAALDHCEWHTDDNSCEDHEEGHGMSLHIIGVSVGSTSFKLELMHGDHADYTSTNNVPVIVVP